MKAFNLFIVVSLIIILGGFLFFKDSFKTTSPELPMNRVSYLDYSKANRDQAQSYGKTILFFAATTWCQTCSALDKEINERLKDIPSDVTILKVDYDNDREMKEIYKVTTQHTLIVLDKNGNELKRWIGGNFDLLMKELQEI